MNEHDRLIQDMGRRARQAARDLGHSATEQRSAGLRSAATVIRERQTEILSANQADLADAESRGLSAAMIDRLRLDPDRLDGIAEGLEAIAELPDPLERVLADWTQPNGLHIQRVAVPIGVIGVIYESRPNVTVDAAGLCVKSGNAVILRGGSEAVNSNRALHEAFSDGLTRCGLNAHSAQFLPTQDREAVGALLRAHDSLDLVVPRGGKGLVKRVQTEARVPVLAHLDGNNHLYIHPSADPDMARDVVINAKLRRPGICGALETLLIDQAWIEHAPALLAALTDRECELRGDQATVAIHPAVQPARAEDWDTEYLAPVLSIRVVGNAAEALDHIRRHGSGHTDGILAGDLDAARDFLKQLDSAIAMHNASTQYADGGEFGFGAEIGIATGRLHARGPVGVEQLTTFQYRVFGSGQTRP